MKTKIFTSLLLITVSLCGFAQDKASLNKAMLKMIEVSERQDLKSLVDFTYPKVFTKVSKEEYLKQLEKKKRTDEYTIFTTKTDPAIDYDAIKRTKEGLFCIVHYNTLVNVTLKNKVNKKDLPELVNRFKKILNVKDVNYTESSNSLSAKNRIEVVAIFDDASQGRWTFIDPTDQYANEVLNQDIKNALDPNYVAPPVAKPKPALTTSTPTPARNKGYVPHQKTDEERAAEEQKLKSGGKRN